MYEDVDKRLQLATQTAMHQEHQGVGTATVAVNGLQTAVIH